MMVIDRLETFDQSKIANGFNKFFTDIEPKFSLPIPSSFKDFKDFLSAVETNLDEYLLQDKELNEAFNSLRSNKNPGFADTLPNVVVKTYSIRSNIFLVSC